MRWPRRLGPAGAAAVAGQHPSLLTSPSRQPNSQAGFLSPGAGKLRSGPAPRSAEPLATILAGVEDCRAGSKTALSCTQTPDTNGPYCRATQGDRASPVACWLADGAAQLQGQAVDLLADQPQLGHVVGLAQVEERPGVGPGRSPRESGNEPVVSCSCKTSCTRCTYPASSSNGHGHVLDQGHRLSAAAQGRTGWAAPSRATARAGPSRRVAEPKSSAGRAGLPDKGARPTSRPGQGGPRAACRSRTPRAAPPSAAAGDLGGGKAASRVWRGQAEQTPVDQTRTAEGAGSASARCTPAQGPSPGWGSRAARRTARPGNGCVFKHGLGKTGRVSLPSRPAAGPVPPPRGGARHAASTRQRLNGVARLASADQVGLCLPAAGATGADDGLAGVPAPPRRRGWRGSRPTQTASPVSRTTRSFVHVVARVAVAEGRGAPEALLAQHAAQGTDGPPLAGVGGEAPPFLGPAGR